MKLNVGFWEDIFTSSPNYLTKTNFYLFGPLSYITNRDFNFESCWLTYIPNQIASNKFGADGDSGKKSENHMEHKRASSTFEMSLEKTLHPSFCIKTALASGIDLCVGQQPCTYLCIKRLTYLNYYLSLHKFFYPCLHVTNSKYSIS